MDNQSYQFDGGIPSQHKFCRQYRGWRAVQWPWPDNISRVRLLLFLYLKLFCLHWVQCEIQFLLEDYFRGGVFYYLIPMDRWKKKVIRVGSINLFRLRGMMKVGWCGDRPPLSLQQHFAQGNLKGEMAIFGSLLSYNKYNKIYYRIAKRLCR